MTRLVDNRLGGIFKTFGSKALEAIGGVVKTGSKSWYYDFSDNPTANTARDKPLRMTRKPPYEFQLPKNTRINPTNNTGIWLTKYDLLLTLNNTHYLISYNPKNFGVFKVQIVQDVEKTRIFALAHIAKAAPVLAEKKSHTMVFHLTAFTTQDLAFFQAKQRAWTKYSRQYKRLGIPIPKTGPSVLREYIQVDMNSIGPETLGAALRNKEAGRALWPFLVQLKKSLARVKFKALIRDLDEDTAKLLLAEAIERGSAYKKANSEEVSITAEVDEIAREYGIKASLEKLARVLGGYTKYERDVNGVIRKVLKVSKEVIGSVVTMLELLAKPSAGTAVGPLVEAVNTVLREVFLMGVVVPNNSRGENSLVTIG
ncbi:hypothetical protein A3L09_10695 (plasmid) [Thermococcus profundus]|uniref:Uncharacterized protein n=1 Tax=Thermococcus profundus TaxID=49899 RepID=A0A2Z2MPK8_THEPR|nr:hypothetical protein [Thermococcus profundus]ASJ03818.1 hypothetical protein A3L09_10695 [Thermococcus profundus]